MAFYVSAIAPLTQTGLRLGNYFKGYIGTPLFQPGLMLGHIGFYAPVVVGYTFVTNYEITSPAGPVVRALGSPVIAGPIIAPSIEPVQALGNPTIAGPITAPSITPVQDFGAHSLNLTVKSSSLISRAFGTHLVALRVTIHPPSLVTRVLVGGTIIRPSARIRPTTGDEGSDVELLTIVDLQEGWASSSNVTLDGTNVLLIANAGGSASTTSIWSSRSIDAEIEIDRLESEGRLPSTGYAEVYLRAVQASQYFEIAYRRTRNGGLLCYGNAAQTISYPIQEPRRLRILTGGSLLTAYVDSQVVFSRPFDRVATSAEIGLRAVGNRAQAQLRTKRKPVVTFSGHIAPVVETRGNSHIFRAPEGLEGAIQVGADFGSTEYAGLYTYVERPEIRLNRDSGVRVRIGKRLPTVTPELSPPVISGIPTLSGITVVGSTLTATPASTTGGPNPARTWVWYRGTTEIVGAVASTYTLTMADVGSTIQVRQVETNAFDVATALSLATATVTSTP